MAELNNDCVRDLLLYLEENMRYRESGRVVNINMKHIRHQMENRSYEDLYEAAKYLCENGLVTCVGGTNGKTPKAYRFNGITPKGYAFIQAMRDDTVWNRAKATMPSFLEKGIDCAIQFLAAVAVQKG